MKFALAVRTIGENTSPVIELDGSYYSLEELVPGIVANRGAGLLDLFVRWDSCEGAIIKALEEGRHEALESLGAVNEKQWDAPIKYPSKVICTGVNYYDHLRDDMRVLDFDKASSDILFFQKHPRAIVGASSGTRYPSQSRELDWEVELVVVFGRRARRVSAGEAMDAVAGYAIGLDFSARDWQMNPRHFKKFDLFAGKSFDDSSPLGPFVVPARFVDPTALTLRLWVNGKLEQDSSTREMIWSIPEQIAQLSQHMTIEPGDLLYTGSPAGIGWIKERFLKEGDEVSAEIGGLGRLSISVLPDPDASSAVGL